MHAIVVCKHIRSLKKCKNGYVFSEKDKKIRIKVSYADYDVIIPYNLSSKYSNAISGDLIDVCNDDGALITQLPYHSGCLTAEDMQIICAGLINFESFEREKNEFEENHFYAYADVQNDDNLSWWQKFINWITSIIDAITALFT